MRLEIKIYIDVDKDTDLAEFENELYNIDSIGAIFVDVAKIDIIEVK